MQPTSRTGVAPASVNSALLTLFLLSIASIVYPADSSVSTRLSNSKIDFLPTASGSLPVWLISGPFSGIQKNLEPGLNHLNSPVEGDKASTGTWSYLNVANAQIIQIPNPDVVRQKKVFFYAHTGLKFSRKIDAALIMNSLGRSVLWLDGVKKFTTRLDPAGKIQQGFCRVQLKAGIHTIRLRLQTVGNKTVFALFAVTPDSSTQGFTPITGACIRLNMRNWTAARQQQEAAKCLHLSSRPRFVDAAKRLYFTLRLQGGLPLVNSPLILKLTGRDSQGKVWINARSLPASIDAARLRGLRIAVNAPKTPSWERLPVQADLQYNGKILGSATAPIFCDKNLKLAANRLSNFFEDINDRNSSAAALIRLSMEQAEIFSYNRTRKTLKYGERFFGFIERARNAAKAFAENRDPLTGLTGIQEGAYISRADDSVQPYRFFVPSRARLQNCKPLPILVMLHGYVPYYDKLNWMNIDASMAATMEKLGWFMLLPFGRSNTDFLSIGEDDVLQAISEIQRRYPVDPRRIFLAGYSMGGSGVWTLLSHYPGRFAAAQIWSGRTDYYFWHAEDYARAGVKKTTIPAWKRWLINTDNPYDLFRTMTDIPIRVVHPDDDTLVKPGHTRRIYELLKPPSGMMKMVVPPPGEGHWYFSREISNPSTYLWMLKARSGLPNEIEHVCFTPKYGTKSWLRITALRKWGALAHVKARLDLSEKRILVTMVENVMGLSLVPCTALPKIRDFKIELSRNLARKISATWESTTRTLWLGAKAMSADKPMKAAVGATAGLYGPVKEAFNGPFVLVYGTAGSRNEDQELSAKAARFQDEWWRFAKGKPRIVRDVDLTPGMVKARNLILFGSPATNTYVHKIANRLPFGFPGDGYSIFGRKVRAKNLGLVGIYPNPENPSRYVVIMDGLYYGDNLPINHKWDLVPDYIIFSSATDAYDNTNTAKLAGVFDSFWK